jgi:foldase protein PrsA
MQDMQGTGEGMPSIGPSSEEKPMKETRRKHDAAMMRNFLLGGAIGVVILVLAVLGVFTVGIYKFGWKGPASSVLVHAVPLPAASVNGKLIRYSEFVDQVDTLHRFFEQQRAAAQGAVADFPSDTEIRKNVMDRLIYETVLREQAEKFGVTVAKADIDTEYGKLVADQAQNNPGSDSAAAEAAIAQELKDMYNWTPEQFKDKVLYPYLLQQRLAEALKKDQALSGDAKKSAEDVLAKVKAGGDFAALAAQYSQDSSNASQGGELGFFERGIMVKEFEDAAFSMKAGETSDLVETQFGFHIINVEEVEKDPKSGEVTKVRARHILLSSGPDVEKFVEDAIAKATVRKFVE